MTAKIRSSYGNDADFRTVMDYIHSRTDGQAWQIIENHGETGRSAWTSIDAYWEELDNNYLPKDEEAKAESENDEAGNVKGFVAAIFRKKKPRYSGARH